jgi:hypothetical protein
MEKVIKTWLLIISFMLPGMGILWAQGVQFTTAVSSTQIGVGEPFRVQFTINNASNISGFQAPAFHGFEILSRSQSQSTSIINGKVSQSVTFEFILQANAQGRYTIAGAKARIDGDRMQSNPISVSVEKGYANSNNNQSRNNPAPQAPNPFGFAPPALQRQLQSQPGILRNGESPMEKIKKNVFVKVNVDKTNVYAGQQITATYKLFTRLPTSSQVTKVPSFTGFSSHDIKLSYPIQPSVEDINGVPFKVFIIRKTMLFPLQSGTLELDPAEVDNTVRLYTVERQKASSSDPFDDIMNDPFFKSAIGNDPFFQQAFGGSDVTYHDYDYNTSSPPVMIHVKPLPETGKPADFTGAVGNYTINASLDKTKLNASDAATLKVTISGTGNISLLSAPQVDLSSDFDNYTPTITDKINANSNPYGGSRTFTYVLMPKVAGNFTIPPVKFAYFDPAKEEYKTIETSAFTLDVTPGGNKNGNSINYTSEGNNVLQPIRNGRLVWSKAGLLGFGTWWYWLLLIIPLVILVLLYLLKRRNDSLQSNTVLLKNKRANRIALKRLSQANQFLQQNKPKEFYNEVSQAVWGYLCDKFDIPYAELSKQKAQEKLFEKQVNGHTPEKLFELLDNCEVALYAGSEGHEQMKTTYRDAVTVITHLEEQFKKS